MAQIQAPVDRGYKHGRIMVVKEVILSHAPPPRAPIPTNKKNAFGPKVYTYAMSLETSGL